ARPVAVAGVPLPLLRLERHKPREHLRPHAVPVAALLPRLQPAVRAVQDDLTVQESARAVSAGRRAGSAAQAAAPAEGSAPAAAPPAGGRVGGSSRRLPGSARIGRCSAPSASDGEAPSEEAPPPPRRPSTRSCTALRVPAFALPVGFRGVRPPGALATLEVRLALLEEGLDSLAKVGRLGGCGLELGLELELLL